MSTILDQCVKDGTTVHSIEVPSLLDFEVAIAPLREQHRIVAKIDELFSELDKAVESLTLARAQLKTYRQALLKAAIDGQLLVWKGERRGPFSEDDSRCIAELVSDMGQGWSPRCHNYAAESDQSWAVMKTTAIQHLVFNDRENKELPSALAPRPRLELKAGDLLITRAGPRPRVGVACLVRKVRGRLMLCDKAYRLRVIEARVLPEYLELILNSPDILWEIERIKTGINDSGVNLTQSKFLEIHVPVPSIDEQHKTLAYVSEVLSNTDVLVEDVENGLAKVTSLRQSILKKAFSGQLLPQDPTDEPAVGLLARLREQTPPARTRPRNTA